MSREKIYHLDLRIAVHLVQTMAESTLLVLNMCSVQGGSYLPSPGASTGIPAGD